MAKYVSAEVVYELIKDRFGEGEAEALMSRMPIEDAKPVKRGKWICTNDYETLAYGTLYYSRCSVCGEESLETDDFCPNCGAEMEEV